MSNNRKVVRCLNSSHLGELIQLIDAEQIALCTEAIGCGKMEAYCRANKSSIAGENHPAINTESSFTHRT